MDKKLLNINFQKSFIEYFPYGDEKLFIDMKIKEDEQSREKAKEYAGYLEELKNYVEFEDEKEVDEIIEFLKSKSEVLKNVSQEEKREYMELKFDLLNMQKDINIVMKDGVYQFETLNTNYFEIAEDLGEYFTLFFPSFNKKYVESDHINEYFNYLLYLETYSKNKNISGELNEIKEKNRSSEYINIKDFNFIFRIIQNINMLDNEGILILPIIFPIYKKWGKTNIILWDIKILHFKNLQLKGKEGKFLELINNFFVGDKNLELVGKTKNYIVNDIFQKTNLFCDYRFFDREMIK